MSVIDAAIDGPVLGHEEALRLLDRAVKEKGHDYVDPNAEKKSTCEYFTADGTPACIVGHVLAYLGIARTDIWDNQTTEVVELAADLWRKGYLHISPEALGLLEIAQKMQDRGDSWGEVLNHVTREANRGDYVAYEFSDEGV